jgi:Cu-Zn family superoxide dismutase
MTRSTRLATALLALGASVACRSHPDPINDGSTRAVAFLLDTAGKDLTETPGMPGVTYTLQVDRGATTGQHGIHFHTVGTCDAATKFASAGGHFNPTTKKHGLMSADGPHAGDLEALTIDSFGHGTFTALDPRITLTPGANSLLDADGSSIVLHALPDDQRTDPSGSSGARVACGVIVRI